MLVVDANEDCALDPEPGPFVLEEPVPPLDESRLDATELESETLLIDNDDKVTPVDGMLEAETLSVDWLDTEVAVLGILVVEPRLLVDPEPPGGRSTYL